MIRLAGGFDVGQTMMWRLAALVCLRRRKFPFCACHGCAQRRVRAAAYFSVFMNVYHSDGHACTHPPAFLCWLLILRWPRSAASADSSSIEVAAFDDDPHSVESGILSGPHPKADLLAAHAASLSAICPFVSSVEPVVRRASVLCVVFATFVALYSLRARTGAVCSCSSCKHNIAIPSSPAVFSLVAAPAAHPHRHTHGTGLGVDGQLQRTQGVSVRGHGPRPAGSVLLCKSVCVSECQCMPCVA